jgi:hypothetical protein
VDGTVPRTVDMRERGEVTVMAGAAGLSHVLLGSVLGRFHRSSYYFACTYAY